MRHGCLLVFLAVTCLPSNAWGAWPVKEFKVIPRAPSSFPPPPEQEVESGVPGSLAVKIEGYLQEIASQFENEQFQPPSMPVVLDQGRRKYAVYLYEYDDSPVSDSGSSARLKNPGCDVQWLEVDSSDFTPEFWEERKAWERKSLAGGGSPELTDFRSQDQNLYATLVHELFHAIQGSYDRRYNSLRMCEEVTLADVIKATLDGETRFSSGAAAIIVEGAAAGVAEYLTAKKFPNRQKGSDNRRLLGGFPHIYPFFDPPDGAEYYSRSFWLFIAEQQRGLGFMEYLLRQPIKSRPSSKDRIKWLDDAFRKQDCLDESLYTLFPRFTTQLYSFAPTRYPKVSEGDWISWLSSKEGCQRKMDSPSSPIEIPLRDLEPFSARCLEIEWPDFEEPVRMWVEAVADSQETADQLHLGMSKLVQSGSIQYCWDWSGRGGGQAGQNSCLEEKLQVQTGPGSEKYAKLWIVDEEMFNQPGFARLIVANVAPPQTPKHPNAPGPQATAKSEGILFRYGFARTITPQKRVYQPPEGVGIMTMGAEIRPEPGWGGTENQVASVFPPVLLTSQLSQEAIDPRELVYGVNPGVAMDLEGMPNLYSFRLGEVGDELYSVTPLERYDPGYTGSFKAVVGFERPGQLGAISSMLCAANEDSVPPVGTIQQSDEMSLRISISTNLCQMKFGPLPARPPFPVVDTFEATIVLPFGWRYFATSAPQDIVTPGVEVYMERYYERIGSMPGFNQIMNRYLGGTSGGRGGGQSGMGSQGEGSSGASEAGCDCSCQGFRKLEELRGGKAPEDMGQMMAIAACAMECAAQWQSCQE